MGTNNIGSLGDSNSIPGVFDRVQKITPRFQRYTGNKVSIRPYTKICAYRGGKYFVTKTAIEKVPKSDIQSGFYSRFFLVPKKDEGVRPILNLRPLNRFVSAPHFKMQTLKAILQSLNPNDWVTKLDLKDAYFHIPIRPKHRKFLRFAIQGQCHQFKALCFGLASAPRVFTKVMAVLGAKLHAQQVQVCMYLDDWLIIDQCKHSASQSISRVIQMVLRLGLIPNVEKSCLAPSQNMEYLGTSLDLTQGVVRPTEERFKLVREAVESMLVKAQVPARYFLRLLGLMAACLDTIPWGRLAMRPIQLFLLTQWRPHVHSIEENVILSPILGPHLKWWIRKENFFQGMSLSTQNAQIVITTDASMQGWGAHMRVAQICRKWDRLTAETKHINWLEMKAVSLALKHFKQDVQGKVVMIRTNNTTVISYLNKQGGTRSPSLCILTWELLSWCKTMNMTVKAAHIPGKRNVIADRLSHGRTTKNTEWSLLQTVVNQIFQVWDRPHIDLFASDKNKKLPIFCSPVPHQNAEAVDAFSVSWEGILAYVFPPPILLSRVLKKIWEENCIVILIAPNWPRQPWFPMLLKLLVAIPMKLPERDDLLTQDQGQNLHPDPSALNLVAWKLSRQGRLKKAFLAELQALWRQQDAQAQREFTMHGYANTTVGVESGMSIPLLLL